MKNIRIVFAFLAVTILATGSTAYALSTQPSDYSQDVTAGKKELANDKAANNQAVEVDSAENTVGQIDDGEVGVDQTVVEQEGNMGEDQGGESLHGDANVTESTDNVDATSSGTTDSTSHNDASN